MAHIANPYNLDDDDDAVFSALLSQGLIWVEEGDEDSGESEIELLESITKGKPLTLNGHTSRVNDVVVSSDFAISASSDKTLRVWHWKTGEHLRTLEGHTNSVNGVAISGDFAISASSDKTLRVWHWKTGEHLRTLTDGSSHELSNLVLDGDFVFAVSVADIWIWNWKSGEYLQKLTGWHTSGISNLIVDGDLILSISGDSLRVRNWRTEKNLHKLVFRSMVEEWETLALNKDFAIFLDSYDIRVWNWKTGEYLDESALRSKRDNKLDNIVFSAPYSVGIYDRATHKWYVYDPNSTENDIDNEIGVFTEDYSHIIAGDDSGNVHVASVAPALLRLITSVATAEKSSRNKHKVESAGKPLPEYKISDVLKTARDYIRQRNEEWVNFSRVSQHLHQTFQDLNPKNLRQPNKSYKSLLQVLADHPSDFELRPDSEKQGLYWIRIKKAR